MHSNFGYQIFLSRCKYHFLIEFCFDVTNSIDFDSASYFTHIKKATAIGVVVAPYFLCVIIGI